MVSAAVFESSGNESVSSGVVTEQVAARQVALRRGYHGQADAVSCAACHTRGLARMHHHDDGHEKVSPAAATSNQLIIFSV
jgi:alpha-D-ribose 1-methylphosphonate 5-triphosphate diphosphatase PhnM